MKLSDHSMLCKWWKENRFPIINLDDLPMSNGELQGVVVHENGVDICAGFIINTNVKNGAMFEYPVADFQIKDRDLRDKAIEFLINTIVELCKKMGKKYVFMSLKNPSLMKHLDNCGFIKGSVNTIEMIKPLT